MCAILHSCTVALISILTLFTHSKKKINRHEKSVWKLLKFKNVKKINLACLKAQKKYSYDYLKNKLTVLSSSF